MEMPRLQELITDNDITQKELADIIGVTRKQVNSWINGHAEMGIDKLIKICRHFKVSADYILELEKGLDWPREEKSKNIRNCTKYAFLFSIMNISILAYRCGIIPLQPLLTEFTEIRYRDKI